MWMRRKKESNKKEMYKSTNSAIFMNYTCLFKSKNQILTTTKNRKDNNVKYTFPRCILQITVEIVPLYFHSMQCSSLKKPHTVIFFPNISFTFFSLLMYYCQKHNSCYFGFFLYPTKHHRNLQHNRSKTFQKQCCIYYLCQLI